MTTLQMAGQPESVLLVASVLWIGAALATGSIHRHRFPSEFPFLFGMIGFISSMIGVTEMVPESVDVALTLIGVLLFAATPVVVTWKLYRSYPPKERGNPTGAL